MTERENQHRKKTLTAERRRELKKKKKSETSRSIGHLTELQLAAATTLGKKKFWRTTSKITSDSSSAARSVDPVAEQTGGAACNLGSSSYSSYSSNESDDH